MLHTACLSFHPFNAIKSRYNLIASNWLPIKSLTELRSKPIPTYIQICILKETVKQAIASFHFINKTKPFIVIGCQYSCSQDCHCQVQDKTMTRTSWDQVQTRGLMESRPSHDWVQIKAKPKSAICFLRLHLSIEPLRRLLTKRWNYLIKDNTNIIF